MTGNEHRLRVIMSRLPAPGSRLPAPGSRLPAPGSRLPGLGVLKGSCSADVAVEWRASHWALIGVHQRTLGNCFCLHWSLPVVANLDLSVCASTSRRADGDDVRPPVHAGPSAPARRDGPCAGGQRVMLRGHLGRPDALGRTAEHQQGTCRFGRTPGRPACGWRRSSPFARGVPATAASHWRNVCLGLKAWSRPEETTGRT